MTILTDGCCENLCRLGLLKGYESRDWRFTVEEVVADGMKGCLLATGWTQFLVYVALVTSIKSLACGLFGELEYGGVLVF